MGLCKKNIVLFLYSLREHAVRYLIAVREATEFWKKQFNREDPRHEHTCAAYFKLSEALQRFDVCVEGKNCIDIGAAPGGWVPTLQNICYKK